MAAFLRPPPESGLLLASELPQGSGLQNFPCLSLSFLPWPEPSGKRGLSISPSGVGRCTGS